MNRNLTRRAFFGWSAGALAVSQAGPINSPGADVIETRVISHCADLYHGWPTVARRASGELVLVYSGGREAHVCPFGRVELMRSRDEGRTWSWPRVLCDQAIDDRDAGIVETPKGTLLATTFTSLAYAPQIERLARTGQKPGSPGARKLARWAAAHGRLADAERRSTLGCWMLRSEDGGVSWSAPARCPVNSPHGPVVLADGALLYAGKELWHGRRRIGVCRSDDDGRTWRWLATLPARPGESAQQYHELHAVQAEDGRLLVHIRNHHAKNARETLQSESADGGRTWSVPRTLGVWGLPSHLLRLRDGRLVMTYGYRRAPYGNQARISTDHGRTWSSPVVLSSDGASGDLGYPSSVELSDGNLLTVWYEKMRGAPRAVLRQATWKTT